MNAATHAELGRKPYEAAICRICGGNLFMQNEIISPVDPEILRTYACKRGHLELVTIHEYNLCGMTLEEFRDRLIEGQEEGKVPSNG